MMKAKKWMILLLSLLLASGILSGCSNDDATTGSFSSFTGYTLDGETFTQDDIKSKDLTIINYWGMFCGPCRAEMPDLAAYEKALPENVQLITICIDAGNDLEGTRDFLTSCGYEGVTLISGDEALASVVNTVQSFPTTVFVNSRGEVKGTPIIGMQPDLSEAYTTAANKVLSEEGKAEISLAD